MSVEGVIFDVSDTLVQRDGSAAPGVSAALDRLRAAGVQIIAANNNGPQRAVAAQLQRAGLTADHIVTAREVGKNKGSPEWLDYIERVSGLARHQLVYVGDSKQDMITASHSKTIYMHAAWTNAQSDYGIQAPTPNWVAAAVLHIFRKQHSWGWQFQAHHSSGRRVRQMTLLDGNGSGDDQFKKELVAMLKDQSEPQAGPMSLRVFVVLHLLASLYQERLHEETDVWTTYPSRTGTRTNRMGQMLDAVAKLFRDRYHGDVFLRHTPAMHSRDAFWAHQDIGDAIENQLATVTLNPVHQRAIQGKTVLLLDDFLTRGVTTGVARSLLLAGGAADVVVVGVGKYGETTHILAPPADAQWNPYVRATIQGSDFRYREVQGTLHQVALHEFRAARRAMQQE